MNSENKSINIRCDVCGNNDNELFVEKYVKNDFTIIECKICSFTFIPDYSKKRLSYEDYKDDEVFNQIKKGNEWLKIQRNLLRFRLIRKFLRSGSLFDVGVGWGHFILTAQKLGYDVSGVEMADSCYKYSKFELNLPVLHGDFIKLKIDNKYDIITMWDVLEHINGASNVIKNCNIIQKPGGFLFIQVPQIDSFIAKRLKVKWIMIGSDHVNYFSPKTITQLLKNNGYEVLKIKSSIELKLLLMYAIYPWLKKFKKKNTTQNISEADRQGFYNKATNLPKWILKFFILIHNFLYKLLSMMQIGEEMIVVARKIRVV